MENLLQPLIRRHRAWRTGIRPRELNEMPVAYLLLMTSLAGFAAFGLALPTVPAAIEWFRVVDELDHIPLEGWLWAALLATFGVGIALAYEFARAHGKALMENLMRIKSKPPCARTAAAERLRRRRQPMHRRA